ncbi:type IV pilus assembly protein FimV [Janthinobacterium agaricidamnosum]|uniref:Transmembrane domain protein n=1 Tax=Janthinobacterium agaricidamnosum NBRC 102515 = DSM 9628 TaxID=1349767 RepID=W0VBJ8_9BURK|nr:hypothetical protein [Janthinobacterium agaricidamnosum]CDG84738.1 transmembrane domain protein [Janthinobacterium agaricidamnosum NBRC 102515 = DSM 9628]
MHRSIFFGLTRRTGAILLAASLCAVAGGAVEAAELGDITVLSYIGQPLTADIELTALAADDINGLRVRVASPDVYRGANIARNPALDGVDISIVQRGAKQFLHLTSRKRIDATYLHVFLELSAGGRSKVRIATLGLSANPAPPAPPLPQPLPVPPAVAAAAPARDPAVPAAKARVALPARTVPAAAVAPTAEAAAPKPPVARPAPPPRQPAPATCGPQAAADSGPQCAALDAGNAALASKLAELEGKVKVLQHALAAPPVAMVEPPAPLKPPALKKPPHVEKKASAGWFSPMAWLALGAVLLLLLIGLGVHLFRNRKKDNRYWVLLRKPFQRKKLAPPPAELPEPPELTEEAPRPE